MADSRTRTDEILRETGALLENDHFVYINGMHGSGWVNKDAINTQPSYVSELCQMLVAVTRDWEANYICGPATGGMIVAQWTAFHAKLPMVYAEHGPAQPGQLRGSFEIRRNFDRLIHGKRVIIVDDVANSGHSVEQTMEAVRAVGAEVVGVAVYVDRGNLGESPFGGVPYRYLTQVQFPAWVEEDCPAELLARPINPYFAHGHDYLEAKKAAAG